MEFFINIDNGMKSVPKVMDKNSLTPICNNFGSKYTIYLGCVKC